MTACRVVVLYKPEYWDLIVASRKYTLTAPVQMATTHPLIVDHLTTAIK